jgi:hypothetical protein
MSFLYWSAGPFGDDRSRCPHEQSPQGKIVPLRLSLPWTYLMCRSRALTGHVQLDLLHVLGDDALAGSMTFHHACTPAPLTWSERPSGLWTLFIDLVDRSSTPFSGPSSQGAFPPLPSRIARDDADLGDPRSFSVMKTTGPAVPSAGLEDVLASGMTISSGRHKTEDRWPS